MKAYRGSRGIALLILTSAHFSGSFLLYRDRTSGSIETTETVNNGIVEQETNACTLFVKCFFIAAYTQPLSP
jgi:hypothetical protein